MNIFVIIQGPKPALLRVDNPPCFDNGKFGEPSFEVKKKDKVDDFLGGLFGSGDDEKEREFDSQSVATGWSVNTTFGFNRTTKMFNFNFTILFNNWTMAFPAGLLDNYRDGSFSFDKFELILCLWIEDPIVKADRPIPVEFYFMVAQRWWGGYFC